MEIKRKALTLAALFLSLLVWVGPGLAQTDESLTLRLRRDFGYSSGTGRIQGAFTLTASGGDDLERVAFKIDDQTIGEADQPPFRLRFSTSDYPLGLHTLAATGVTAGGQTVESNLVRVEFVSADEGWQMAAKIAIPIVGIVFGIMLATFVLPLLFGRGKRIHLPAGAPRSYGALGGATCPKCSRPFAMHVYGLNLLVGKYDRCPYCGKWSLVRRASLQELHAAEAAELEAISSEPGRPDDSEEELRRQIDESRYL